jgi:hypothetical protein
MIKEMPFRMDMAVGDEEFRISGMVKHPFDF